MPKLSFCESGKGCKHLEYRNYSEKRKTYTKRHAYCLRCQTTPQHAKDCDKPGITVMI